MVVETRSAGGIVLNDRGEVALIRSKNSQSWLFPKGRVDPGESDEQAARREVAEETGLQHLNLLGDLGEYSRQIYHFEKQGSERKTIKMFLFKSFQSDLRPTMEIEEARWVPLCDIDEILGSPHKDWFAADRKWFASIRDRVSL